VKPDAAGRVEATVSSFLCSSHERPIQVGRFKLAAIHARDRPDTDWRCPWLRINTLLRDFAGLYRIRTVRTILRPKIAKAPTIRETLRRAHWWN
jgi:hypothetical protein